MSGPINLNHVRKARAREQARKQADANAAAHGLSRAERDRAEAQVRKIRAALDAHKREP
ncbi:DUF4169 family protein [Palleronia rufa]|uniref:DUF4169 family protein n=1 Tax=Palleronia rufa TaxID=1530186 RepID=UPI00056D8C33|nr:DUF4169 family protein [Palleronia rufa]